MAVVDERGGGVAEVHADRAVAQLGDRHLRERRELVEQHVAAVEQVVRLVAVGHRELDRGVQLGDLVGLRADVAGGAGDRGVLGGDLAGDRRDARVQVLDRAGQRLGLLDERLAGGQVLGVVGHGGPGRPELVELGGDAVRAGLGEAHLHLRHRRRGALVLAEAKRLGAELEVEEAVADAAEGLDVDAAAEHRAAAVDQQAGLDVVGRRRGHDGLLAGVALRVGVRDVVARDVHRALVGEESAQRLLQAEEGGDLRHRSS